MKHIRRFLMIAACLLATAASAQWQWVDNAGRKVFSDRAPPPEVPDKNIIKRPGKPTQTDVAGDPAAAASAPQASASAPKLGGVDKDLIEKKKKAEEAQAAKRRAEEENLLKAKVENCARAKQAKATLESNLRLARVNEKGEREVLDAATRAAEIKHAQSIIDSECQ